MNSIKGLLNEYIRLILESAADVSDKALGIYPGEGGQMIILWDPAAMFAALKTGKGSTSKEKILRSDSTWLLAMMTLSSPKPDHWKGWEVKASAAQKGYGPGIYDVAMSLFGAIYSDRGSVSSSAKNIWRYYKDKRGDIKKLPFDDKRSPKTKPEIDDADIFPDGESNPLNYAYKGAKMPTGVMRSKHNTALASLAKETGMSISILNGLVIDAAEEFFASRYES